MFNLLLALITGLIIGWNFHSFFLQLNPPNILKNDINITQVVKAKIAPTPIVPPVKPTIQEIKKDQPKVHTKTVHHKIISKEKNVSASSIKKSDGFYDLLYNDLFSDAMSLYLDASESKLLLYQPTLLEYFETKVEDNPQEAVEKMLEFQEIEPNHNKVNIEILHEIEDNNYIEKAKILLTLIKEKINKTEEYTHQLPLKKIGEHYAIDVTINNEPITLLLDTGATLTLVNEEKLSTTLATVKENIILNTAGGEINAKLQEADSFRVEDIQLKKFQVVSSNFEQKEADGLLGMNFFKKFKFKIDQENDLLLLSEKEEEKAAL